MANYRLTLMKNPAGTYSFVGSVPASLFKEVKATKEDVMAGRAYKSDWPAMELVAPRARVFDTKEEAVEYANSVGIFDFDVL